MKLHNLGIAVLFTFDYNTHRAHPRGYCIHVSRTTAVRVPSPKESAAVPPYFAVPLCRETFFVEKSPREKIETVFGQLLL